MKKRILTLLVTVAMFISLAIVASAAVSFNSETTTPGETIVITLNVSDDAEVTSIAFTPVFDKNVLEFVSDKALIASDIFGSFDGTTTVIGFAAPTKVTGNVYQMTFKVKDNAAFGDYAFSCGYIAKNSVTNTTVQTTTANGTVTVVCAHKNLTYTAGVDATCCKEGVVENYFCSDCNTTFADKACTTKLSTTVVPKNDNHEGPFEVRDAVAATSNTQGYTGDTYCTACGKLVTKGSKLPVIIEHLHNYSKTWKYNTFLHWKECTECKGSMFFVAGHDMEWVVDKEATETAKGSKHKECTVCGYSTNLNTVIPMLKAEETTTAAPETTAPVEETTAAPETTAPVETTTGVPADTKDPSNGKPAQTGDINVVAISIVAAIAVLGLGVATVAKKKFSR